MFPDVGKHLMGAREIEHRLGVSRQRVQQLLAREDWPEPYDVLAMGKVWRNEDVDEWIRKHRPDLARTEAAEESPRRPVPQTDEHSDDSTS